MKEKLLGSPFPLRLTLYQQQTHSPLLQTSQPDQHTFHDQTFLYDTKSQSKYIIYGKIAKDTTNQITYEGRENPDDYTHTTIHAIVKHKQYFL